MNDSRGVVAGVVAGVVVGVVAPPDPRDAHASISQLEPSAHSAHSMSSETPCEAPFPISVKPEL